MALVSKEKAIDTKFRRHGLRTHAVRFDRFEGLEQSVDIVFRLFVTPGVSSIAVNFVKTYGCRFLNKNGHG